MEQETHFTIAELTRMWGFSYATIRRMFLDEPGVLRIRTASGRRYRSRTSIRIPESVATRVYQERMNHA